MQNNFYYFIKSFSIGDSFKFNATQLVTHLNFMRLKNATDLVTRQHDSRENVKEFVVTSPHVMPRPNVSRLETRTLNSRRKP